MSMSDMMMANGNGEEADGDEPPPPGGEPDVAMMEAAAAKKAAELALGGNGVGQGGEGAGRMVQVTNIAPQATRDQMMALFSMLGVPVDDLRLYPTVRDASVSIQSRCAFIKFAAARGVDLCQHLNNTVFIDRAIIVTPLLSSEMPDEELGLQMAAATPGPSGLLPHKAAAGDPLAKLPPHVTCRVEGIPPHAVIQTHDPKLSECDLPQYPPVPATVGAEKVEEIRRTVVVMGLDSHIPGAEVMKSFTQIAGEIKYFRFCSRSNDPVKYALIEFTEQPSVAKALMMNDRQIGDGKIKVCHSLVAITKPRAKSQGDAQKEIEEAMSKVKEAQSLVSAAVDPLMGLLGVTASATGTTTTVSASGSRGASTRNSMARSRSRSRSRRRSRDRGGRRMRSRSRERRRRSRDRRRSRSRDRRRSRDRKKRSRSRDRHRRRSRSRDRHKKDKDKDKEDAEAKAEKAEDKAESDSQNEIKPEHNEAPAPKEGGESKTENGSGGKEADERRSKSKEKSSKRKRSRSRSRDRDRRRRRTRSRDRRRSRSRDRRRRSRSRDRKRRSRSRDKKERKRSRDRKSGNDDGKATSKVARDYDQEEAGYEQQTEAAPASAPSAPAEKRPTTPPEPQPEGTSAAESAAVTGGGPDDMEISNSP